jgi:hypothetical protein
MVLKRSASGGNTFDQHLLLLTLTALTGVLRGLVVMACLEVQIS